MNTQFKAALRYSIRDAFKGVGVVLLVLTGVMLFFIVSFRENTGYVHYTGGEMALWIYFFVYGCVGVREKQRLFNQMGMTRRTAYLAELLGIAAAALVGAAALELIIGLTQILDSRDWFFAGNLYQGIYLGFEKETMPLAHHGAAVLFNTCFAASMATVGQLFSLLFWRMSKRWTVAVAISIPILCNLIPWGLAYLGSRTPAVQRLFTWLAEFWLASPWNVMLTTLLVAAVWIAVNFGLLKKVNIRAAK